jgi:hypothetical protein
MTTTTCEYIKWEMIFPDRNTEIKLECSAPKRVPNHKKYQWRGTGHCKRQFYSIENMSTATLCRISLNMSATTTSSVVILSKQNPSESSSAHSWELKLLHSEKMNGWYCPNCDRLSYPQHEQGADVVLVSPFPVPSWVMMIHTWTKECLAI